MSSKQTLHRVPVPYLLCYQVLFLLFVFVSSCTNNAGGFSFPSSKTDIWCTYNVAFNEGTSQVEMDKQKEDMRSLVLNNTRSTEEGIQCDPTANWVKIDDLHWQLEVTVNCFRLSDTSTVRPPSGTKPPPARVADGTVEKSGCPDEEIKK
jgi:hypothetical protein